MLKKIEKSYTFELDEVKEALIRHFIDDDDHDREDYVALEEATIVVIPSVNGHGPQVTVEYKVEKTE